MSSLLEFPKESVELAQQVAGRYKRRSKSRMSWASNLYDGDFLEITYGFGESLRSGNCGPYLHEIAKEGECFTKAVAYYLVARELGLNPKFYWASDMKDLKEGQSSSDVGSADHSFITVEARKGIEQMVDPSMNAWGEATFSKDGGIVIYDKGERKIKQREYSALRLMSEQEVLEKVEKNRSREGGRLVLSGSQRIKSHGRQINVTYNPKTHEISTKLPFSIPGFKDEPYKKSEVYKLETIVEDDGSFDFSNGNYVSYYAGKSGWSNHVDEQEPMVLPVSVSEVYWNLFDTIVRKTGKRRDAHRIGTKRLITWLIESGLNYDFSAQEGSLAEEVVDENFSDQIRSLKWHQTRAVNDFLERAKKDDVTWRVFLRDAQYSKSRKGKVSDENPFGLVHSFDEHEQFFIDQFDLYGESVGNYLREFIESVRIEAGLREGSKFKADRMRNVSENRMKQDVDLFNYLLDLRKMKSQPKAYRIEADPIMFSRQFDVENDSLSRLGNNLTERDLLNAGKDRFFDFLASGATNKGALFSKAFHPGLRKILDRS